MGEKNRNGHRVIRTKHLAMATIIIAANWLNPLQLLSAEILGVSAAGSFASSPSWSKDYSAMGIGVINPDNWNIEKGNNNGWGNDEKETYSASNARVADGALVITAQKSGSGYTSARITTKGKFDFMYGKIDIVAELPTGRGVWPALWFLPAGSKYSDNSAGSNSWLSNGEIDLAEGSSQGDNSISGSVHSLNHYSGHSERTGTATVSSPSTKFHTYTMEWTPNSIDLSLDGKSYEHVTNNGGGFKDWPYDQKFYLIMNIAIGGTMSNKQIDDSTLPAQMKVRSINYYPYNG